MEADFAVELGADDEKLEMPWGSGDNGPRYHDLKRHPEYLSRIEEAVRYPELGQFLAALNSPTTLTETAKCDAWDSTEINLEEDIFGGSHKFGSYVDVVFSDEARYSFSRHERFAQDLVQLLKKAPEISASAEFLIRRCCFQIGAENRDGLYITLYVFGYGDDEPQARQRWAIALKLVENAIRQMLRAEL
jgi:hypothetical protein